MSQHHTAIDIDYVANLARLDLTPEEKARFQSQLENVLDYFNSLNEVNVEGVQPTSHAFDVYNIWQDDIPGPTFTPQEALANAPAQRDNQIEVPIVVEGE